MKRLSGIGFALLVAITAILGFANSMVAQDTTQQSVNVIGCVDPDCADTVNIFTMEGATVSSYSPEGEFIQSCTVTAAGDDFDGCVVMTVPMATYVVTPGPGYEAYTLLSTEPTAYDSPQTGTGLLWYFVPPSEEPAPRPEMKVNAIACSDAACADTVNLETMVGTRFTTYNAAGEIIDFCEVFVADDFDGCTLAQHPADGSIDIVPSADYAGYSLLSAEPTVFESAERGTTYVWYFVPPTEEPAPAEPTPAEPTPAQTPTPAKTPAPVVTGLPSTGVGPESASGLPILAVPFLLAGLAMIGTRVVRKH